MNFCNNELKEIFVEKNRAGVNFVCQTHTELETGLRSADISDDDWVRFGGDTARSRDVCLSGSLEGPVSASCATQNKTV